MIALFFAEILKAKKKSIYALFIYALCFPILGYLSFRFLYNKPSAIIPFSLYHSLDARNTQFFPLAVFLILSVSTILNIEYKYNIWQNIFVQPISKLKLYAAKIVFLFLVLQIAFIIYNLSVFLIFLLVPIFFPNMHFVMDSYAIALCNIWLHYMIITLGVVAFHMCVFMLIRNLSISTFIGIFASFLPATWFQDNQILKYLPYSYIRNGTFEYLFQDNTFIWKLNESEIFSLVSFAVFIIIGFQIFKRQAINI